MRIFQVRRRGPTRSALNVLLWWVVVSRSVHAILWLLYRLRCSGASHVPRRGAIVFVSNHQSLWDPPIVGCLVGDRPFRAMARSSLFGFKPFGWVIGQIGAIPLRRGEPDAAAIRAAIAELRSGGCALVFPEGSRTRDGALRKFHSGVLVLVRRSGAVTVPVAIEGAHDVWPHGRTYPKLRGRIRVKAGKAIPAADLLAGSPQEALDRLKQVIETMRLELRDELRQASGGRCPAPGPGDGESAAEEADAVTPAPAGPQRASPSGDETRRGSSATCR